MPNREPNPDAPGYLMALNRTTRNIYAGTADPAKVAKRRARNKVARRQRRINRLREH